MKEKFVITQITLEAELFQEGRSIIIYSTKVSGNVHDTYNDAMAEIESIKKPGSYQIQKLFVKQ